MDSHARVNHRLGSKPRPREISTERSWYDQLQPQGTIPGPNGNMTIVIPAQSGAFVDLESSFLEIEGVLTNITPVVGPTFNFQVEDGLKMGYGDLLWSQINAKIGNELLNDQCTNLNYISSFLRRAITKPAGWSGSNSYNVVTSSFQIGNQVPALYGIAKQVSTQGGAGDMMGYSMCQGQTPVYTSNGGYAECESNFDITTNSAAMSRAIRCFTTPLNNTATPPTVAFTPVARPFSFFSWPANAFTTMPQLLPDGVPVELVFTRSSDAVVLSLLPTVDSLTPGASLTLNSVRLWVRYVQPTAEYKADFNASLIERPLSLPYTKTILTTIPISAGSTQVVGSGLCAGFKPDIVIISFHLSSALQGDYNHSPFSMRTNSTVESAIVIPQLSNIQITWGGVTYPQLQITPRTDSASPNGGAYLDGNDSRAYALYYSASDHGLRSDSSPLLSYNQFVSNYGFYCIDLRGAASFESGAIGTVKHTDEVTSGALQVNGQLVQGSSLPISAVVTCIGGGELIIDAGRMVRRVGY